MRDVSPEQVERETTRARPHFVLGAILEVQTTRTQLDKAAYDWERGWMHTPPSFHTILAAAPLAELADGKKHAFRVMPASRFGNRSYCDYPDWLGHTCAKFSIGYNLPKAWNAPHLVVENFNQRFPAIDSIELTCWLVSQPECPAQLIFGWVELAENVDRIAAALSKVGDAYVHPHPDGDWYDCGLVVARKPVHDVVHAIEPITTIARYLPALEEVRRLAPTIYTEREPHFIPVRTDGA